MGRLAPPHPRREFQDAMSESEEGHDQVDCCRDTDGGANWRRWGSTPASLTRIASHGASASSPEDYSTGCAGAALHPAIRTTNNRSLIRRT